jgi:hypothetical protein
LPSTSPPLSPAVASKSPISNPSKLPSSSHS